MKASRLTCAAALVALLTTGAAPATIAPKTVWVGTVQLTYFRHYVLDNPLGPAVEKDSRSVTITNKRDGTASAAGRIRSTTAYPCSNGTTSGRTELWDVRGKARPVTVSFVANRYQVGYTNPSRKVTVEQRDCFEKRTRTITLRALNVGFQLSGRRRAGATRLTGEWKSKTTCTGACVSHGWSGRWDLRLVTLAR